MEGLPSETFRTTVALTPRASRKAAVPLVASTSNPSAVRRRETSAAAGNRLPEGGEGRRAFVSVKDGDKPAVVPIARRLVALGFELLATSGTHALFRSHSIPSTLVKKVAEGRPSIVDRIKDGDVHFVVNTTAGKREIADSYSIRRETLMKQLPYFTTMTGARAALGAMEAVRKGPVTVRSLQEYHGVKASR